MIAETPNRYYAGLIEVLLKKYFLDKTNYRTMLTKKNTNLDLVKIKQKIKYYLNDEMKKFYLKNKNKIYHFSYPVFNYPSNIKNINLFKIKNINKKLIGIKGTYLIFEKGYVININNHIGYKIEILI